MTKNVQKTFLSCWLCSLYWMLSLLLTFFVKYFLNVWKIFSYFWLPLLCPQHSQLHNSVFTQTLRGNTSWRPLLSLFFLETKGSDKVLAPDSVGFLCIVNLDFEIHCILNHQANQWWQPLILYQSNNNILIVLFNS